MLEFEPFHRLPAGAMYVRKDTTYFPEDPRPHAAYHKVDKSHGQSGLRYPGKRKVVLPAEGERVRRVNPNQHVHWIRDDPPFKIARTR